MTSLIRTDHLHRLQRSAQLTAESRRARRKALKENTLSLGGANSFTINPKNQDYRPAPFAMPIRDLSRADSKSLYLRRFL